MRFRDTILGLGALTVVAAGVAFAQEDAAEGAKTVALRVTAKPGDIWRFRRSVERSVTCPQLATDAADSVSQEYTVKVTAVGEDGTFSLDVAFGAAKGKSKASAETTLEFDSSKALPASESPLDTVMLHSLTYLGGATVKVKIDARGAVTEVVGVRAALAKALAGTPFAVFADQMSDDEARQKLQAYLPPLPGEDHAVGANWKDEQKVEYGPRQKYGFERTWTLAAPKDGSVALTAELRHVPGDSVPEGQTNSGEGKLAESRSAADGMLLSRKVTANFKGEGNFDVDARHTETIERLPAEGGK